jgi:hypothetical protein
MIETCVNSTRIDMKSRSELADTSELLKMFGCREVEQSRSEVNISPQWVPNGLSEIFLQEAENLIIHSLILIEVDCAVQPAARARVIPPISRVNQFALFREILYDNHMRLLQKARATLW